MTVLCVPPLEEEPWPTLGPQVCSFIEDFLVFGPGDLRGEPYRLDPEKRALIYRFYEVYPQGHPKAGRRRFGRCAICQRKGTAKTEFAAVIVGAELHPDGPVRCDGFDAYGQPVGVGVKDPYIPMVAYTEEQTEDLAYAALKVILENSLLADDFDIGIERIMRKDGSGKAVALASAPDARDGARTTFQHFDETHRFTLDRLRAAHRTMMANLPKRYKADAWSLETTTAYAPGENSIAEATMDYARQVAAGKIVDSRLFFFHRQAAEDADLTTVAGIRAAVLEASGPAASWSNIDGIVEQFADPTTDQAYLRRVWLNQVVRASERAFDSERWKGLARADYQVADGALITLGFDGSRFNDATALVGTEIATGFQWTIGCWEQTPGVDGWEVPVAEVEEALAAAMGRWQVWRLYADPPYWQDYVSKWAGEYGEDCVVEWWTNRYKPMAYALRNFGDAIAAGEIAHDGSAVLQRHLGNACRRVLNLRDDAGVPLWVMTKERPDSPHKIDCAMAAVLSWEARSDALKSGLGERSVYEDDYDLDTEEDAGETEAAESGRADTAAPAPSGGLRKRVQRSVYEDDDAEDEAEAEPEPAPEAGSRRQQALRRIYGR